MSRKQSLQKMREVLVERRVALRKAVEGDFSMLRKLDRSGGDVADCALETSYSELSSKLAEAETREVKSIDNALRLMDEGLYGKCEGCKSNIPLARLQAVPYATLCIDCKRLAEDHGHQAGDVVDWSQILPGSTGSIGDMDLNVS